MHTEESLPELGRLRKIILDDSQKESGFGNSSRIVSVVLEYFQKNHAIGSEYNIRLLGAQESHNEKSSSSRDPPGSLYIPNSSEIPTR